MGGYSLLIDFEKLRNAWPIYVPDFIPVHAASILDVVKKFFVAIAENYFER